MKKGLFHLHTKHSFDCQVSPKKIVSLANRIGIQYLVICDHNSLKGSVEARNFAESKGYNITIPIAAEYQTDIGDIIVVGVSEHFIPNKDHKVLCQHAKVGGAYTVLPHPYDQHQLENIDFSLIDCIEVFNSRSSVQNNSRAKLLAKKHNKRMIYGSDSHFFSDITNVTFSYEGSTPFEGTIFPIQLKSTSLWKKELSQLVKSYKTRDLKLALSIMKRMTIAQIY